MTYPLALAITVYVGIGLAFASFAMGAEQAKPPAAELRMGLGDLMLMIAAWPLWALLIVVAKYLGRNKDTRVTLLAAQAAIEAAQKAVLLEAIEAPAALRDHILGRTGQFSYWRTELENMLNPPTYDAQPMTPNMLQQSAMPGFGPQAKW